MEAGKKEERKRGRERGGSWRVDRRMRKESEIGHPSLSNKLHMFYVYSIRFVFCSFCYVARRGTIASLLLLETIASMCATI